MILTDLEFLAQQVVLTPNMEKAIRFLQQNHLSALAEGRTEIDGTRVFAMVNSYTTKIPGKMVELEGHRQYIDVQYLIAGREAIGWAAARQVPITVAYDAVKDFWNGELPAEQLTWLKLSAGQAAVFYPKDAHAPQMAAGDPIAVKKVVVKVAVS